MPEAPSKDVPKSGAGPEALENGTLAMLPVQSGPAQHGSSDAFLTGQPAPPPPNPEPQKLAAEQLGSVSVLFSGWAGKKPCMCC